MLQNPAIGTTEKEKPKGMSISHSRVPFPSSETFSFVFLHLRQGELINTVTLLWEDELYWLPGVTRYRVARMGTGNRFSKSRTLSK